MVNDQGERAPAGQHFETRRKMGLLITGPILFGVGWLGGAAIGFLSYLTSGATARLLNFIPVGGAIGSELVLLGSPGGSNSPTLFSDVLFTAVVTALQFVGITLAVLGIPRRQVLVDDDEQQPSEPRRPREEKLAPIQWSLAPFAPGADFGISLMIRN